jgi:hypothetical protein
VRGKVFRKMRILAGFVRHDARAGKHVRLNDRRQIRSLRAIHVEVAGRASPLHQRQNGVLVGIATTDRLAFLLADKRLVNLHREAFAAHWGSVPAVIASRRR